MPGTLVVIQFLILPLRLYFRSGSSFTGELLSALPTAAYYYEPLYSLRYIILSFPNTEHVLTFRYEGKAIENVIMRDPSKASLVRQRIMGIFNCSWPLLQSLNRNSFSTIRKVSQYSNPSILSDNCDDFFLSAG